MNTHQSIPDKTLALSMKLLAEWQQIQNFDLLLAEQRKVDNSEVTDMAATTCRNYFRNKHYTDWLIQKSSQKPPRGRIKKLLGIAISQLMDNQLPVEIICDTAVRFCKKKFSKFDASFVNGILRSLTSEELPKAPADIQLGLSPELLKQWKKNFSREQIEDFATTLKSTAPMTARLSPEMPDISDLTDCTKKIALPEWAGNIEVFEVTNAKEFLARNNRRMYIQDPAPLLSINLLSPQPGEVIADLCSAPGGKSLLIAQLMNGSGKLISSDISKKRLITVQENLKNYPVCEIRQMDACNPDLEEESLDAVLLDVPCSNSGVIRRKADVRWTFNSKKVNELVELQSKILQATGRLVKKGGRLIYSTCSICPEENIEVVNSFLKNNSNFQLDCSKSLLPTQFHDGSFSCKLIKIK